MSRAGLSGRRRNRKESAYLSCSLPDIWVLGLLGEGESRLIDVDRYFIARGRYHWTGRSVLSIQAKEHPGRYSTEGYWPENEVGAKVMHVSGSVPMVGCG